MSQGGKLTSQTVAEIFMEMGIAFNAIGEFAMMFNCEPDSPFEDKITDTDIQLVRAAVEKFVDDVERMCQRIKDRTLLQIKNTMKRHAYEEAGLPLRKQQIHATAKTAVTQGRVRNTLTVMPQSSAKSADITLNMLNATEQEVDKMDYDSVDN